MNPQSQLPPKNNAGITLIWWLIALSFLIWLMLRTWSIPQLQVTLPYTVFLNQVRTGNVAQVKLAGDQISGSFWRPITWSASDQAESEQKTGSDPTQYSQFRTTYPETIGDPNLLPLLEAHQVEIKVQRPAGLLLTALFMQGLPFLLLFGFLIWMSRRTSGDQSHIFGFGRSQARRYTDSQAKVTFDDVAGTDEAKAELQQIVDYLRQPQKYHDLGAQIPRGTLLVGPPGTGKTLLARAVAGEAEATFFNLSASEFVEMFVGVGASRVRDLFERAKLNTPAIIFIDEMDAVGRRRGAGMGTVNDEREQTLNQLLAEMDGFDERQEVIVLAATNRPDVLDPALLRPGRFDRQVTVALPDFRGREGILAIHTRRLQLAPNIDLTRLAKATTGFSGADLANLCNEAALTAASHNHKQVTTADFEEAQDKILLGNVRPLLLTEQDRQVIAYHEAGHALIAWLIPSADPVYKVTIIPRGRALGVTEQLPEEDRYNHSKTYLLARLAVLLGGRTAEEIVIGDVTTGAENDLVEATRLACKMVTRWGMGSLGVTAFASDQEHPFLGYQLTQNADYSQTTAAHIDQDVQTLLEEQHEMVYRLLSDGRARLDLLAQALQELETLDREKLRQILGPRPTPEQTIYSQTPIPEPVVI